MTRRTLGLVAILTLSAGYVDAVVFFGFGVFVSAMSGNTVLLAGALIAHAGLHVPGSRGPLTPVIAIASFIAGSLTAALIFRAERGHPHARIVLCLLVAFLLIGSAIFHVSTEMRAVWAGVAFLAAAMGMQSITAARLHLHGIWTTFVTGNLLTAILNVAGGPLASPQPRQAARTNSAAWALYFGGALGGAYALTRLGPNALWPAAVAVALLVPIV